MGILFFVVVIVLFVPLNAIAVALLVRIHPRCKPWVFVVTAIGNVMWVFLPWFNVRTDATRLIRALFGPPWFAWICFLFVYNALLLAIAIVWAPFHKRGPFSEFARWPSRIFLWGTLAATIAGAYTALVPLDVRRVPITLRDLPPELDGMRIVELADLHTGLFTRPSRLQQIFETVNGLSPDLVLLDGDLIDDDPAFVPKLLRGAAWLAPSTPLIAVLGNHEMYGAPFDVIARLRGSRIRLLVNEGGQVVRLPGSWGRQPDNSTTRQPSLWIAGLSDYAGRAPALIPNFDAALRGKPPDAFPIVVSHQPRAFPETIRRHLPLALCAHSHGGQCGFRPLRWSLAGLFLPYHMGLYRRGESQLYVNTGTGYWLLPWRLGLLPEITAIELRRGTP